MFTPSDNTLLVILAGQESGRYRQSLADSIRSQEQETKFVFRMDLPAGQDLGIEPGQSARLVMDASRPTLLGWRWDSEPSDEESIRLTCEDRINLPGRGQVRLISTFQARHFLDAEGFVPYGKTDYDTEVQIDSETRTIWWLLPTGRSINVLSGLLGFDEETLYPFVRQWFYDKDDLHPLPFNLEPDSCEGGEEGCMLACSSITGKSLDWVYIPPDLLQDPIRNGSDNPADGFNPWNEDQKARIVAHLETRAGQTYRPLPRSGCHTFGSPDAHLTLGHRGREGYHIPSGPIIPKPLPRSKRRVSVCYSAPPSTTNVFKSVLRAFVTLAYRDIRREPDLQLAPIPPPPAQPVLGLRQARCLPLARQLQPPTR